MRILFRIAVALAVAFSGYAQKPMRLSWQEFAKDPTRVQSFRNAVQEMRNRNTADTSSARYRTSWTFWASIHGYFGTQAKNGTVAQFRQKYGLTDPSLDPYFVNVENTTPPDDVAKKVWDQCQHGTIYFFGWHRLFLFYFEKALQDAAGDPNLHLPYWDYTDPANLAMPAEFTTETYVNSYGQTVPNPLYDARRDPGWNDGGTNTLDEDDTDVDRKLKNDKLLDTSKVVKGYQSQIDGAPHGSTHCAVAECKRTVMGAVAYSSNDPIFWIHHANIDRLWDCWLSIPGHTNPDSVLDISFTFVNTAGELVTNSVRDAFNGSLIDYVYQQASNCQRQPAATPMLTAAPSSATEAKRAQSARKQLARPLVIGTALKARLTAAVTKQRVTLDATASLDHPRQFALEAEPELPVATELVLSGIHFAQHPETSIKVYLERVDDPTKRALVGTLSFFWEEPEEADAHHPQAAITRVFDATEELRELDLEGTGALNLNVVFEAEDQKIGPDFNAAQTQLTVDEILFRVKRD
jgi:hypothetical protein